jgi:hypothetical protein
MIVNYGGDWVQVNYPAGHTVWISATDGISEYFASEVTMPDEGWWSPDGFQTRGDDWTPEQPDIQPFYKFAFSSDDGYRHRMNIGIISGTVDLADRSISGEIFAPWFSDPLQVMCHPETQWPFLYVNATAHPDGSEGYYCQWSPDQWQEVFDQDILVTYVEPDDGDWVTNRFPNPRVYLRVYYDDDKVDGNYEPGHTGWITLTRPGGPPIQYTVEITTAAWPWWGGSSGFSTHHHDWNPYRPDIQPGDLIRASMDNGYTSTVRVGTIAGYLSARTDSVQGTIGAGWLSQRVYVYCDAWGAPGGAPWREDLIWPNGADPYVCSWDPGTEWDVQPGQDVAVSYREPDGDRVYRVFLAGREVYLPLVLKRY